MLLKIILIILAVYRVSYLIVYESGPFAIFEKIRLIVYSKSKWQWVIEGFNCVLCISFWFAAIGALFVDENFVISWLGIAGGVAVLHLFLENYSEVTFDD